MKQDRHFFPVEKQCMMYTVLTFERVGVCVCGGGGGGLTDLVNVLDFFSPLTNKTDISFQ